ncbi:hypothetical protein Tco_1111677 [Tanacetum coccineum]|uniref:Uncharacterized protein n=1 Tax=Tanacetum coccineum TaxID=301880 RepID=A0ABQ5IMN5_9ASTR
MSSSSSHATPLPSSVSPTALSLDYVAESEPSEEEEEKDLEEDLKEEPSEEEEEELSAPADSSPAGLYIDLPSEVEEDETPLPASIDALVDSWVAAPTPLSPLPSSLSPLSSPLPKIPLPPLLLPQPTRRDIIPEADMPPRKRARFAALSHMFEIGESLAAAAAIQPRSTLARDTESGFMTALEEVKESVIDIATRHRQC